MQEMSSKEDEDEEEEEDDGGVGKMGDTLVLKRGGGNGGEGRCFDNYPMRKLVIGEGLYRFFIFLFILN